MESRNIQDYVSRVVITNLKLQDEETTKLRATLKRCRDLVCICDFCDNIHPKIPLTDPDGCLCFQCCVCLKSCCSPDDNATCKGLLDWILCDDEGDVPWRADGGGYPEYCSDACQQMAHIVKTDTGELLTFIKKKK